MNPSAKLKHLTYAGCCAVNELVSRALFIGIWSIAYKLPLIAKELSSLIAKMNNSYVGVVYTNQELSSDYISSIEKQFSKKFDVKLSLSQNVCDYDGIKVDIDGLGVEISFSKERLKSQLIDHILKAV